MEPAMNSALYRALVMHNRLEPKKHRFHYNVFMFWLDLDELEKVGRKIALVGINRFNVFSWRDKDHVQFPAKNPDTKKSTRQHLEDFLEQNGHKAKPASIMLLTNLRTWGYQFNPVSFYFCFDEQRKVICAVAEVGNTFREMKLYYLGPDRFDGTTFRLRIPKYFYVSPFIAHDAEFDFQLDVPGEKLDIRIDDYQHDRRFFISTLTGKRKALTNGNVLLCALRFPLITIKIIALIHWNAMLLWFKKIPFYRKGDHKDLQRDVLKPYDDKTG
ncbi:MAG: hypothetical protein FD123_2986 [Bacteroidetes bacterium]|nr:MAG: hypothetical protein FD123_2986 [Bacteroidota bacterium]